MGTPARYLIVNADDFGLSPGVNEGIAVAHEQGILTSASLMVRWPAAIEAAAYSRLHPGLSVGLHLDLAEWIHRDDTWQLVYQVVPMDDPVAVEREVVRQFDEFNRLMGRPPTHVDSHQHVHHSEPIRSILFRAAQERKIVLRNLDEHVRYCGDFYGQSNKGYPYHEGISVPGLIQILKNLSEGITELGCHPATGADMDGMYCQERLVECDTLCHRDIRATIESEAITLCSFATARGQGTNSFTR